MKKSNPVWTSGRQVDGLGGGFFLKEKTTTRTLFQQYAECQGFFFVGEKVQQPLQANSHLALQRIKVQQRGPNGKKASPMSEGILSIGQRLLI
jgi:hypothetical protein